MALNTGSFSKRLLPGVKAWTGTAYAGYPAEYKDIFNMTGSKMRYEEYVSIGSLGLASRIGEGEPITFSNFEQGFVTRLAYTEYVKGFIITKRIQMDDQYAPKLAQVGSQKLAYSMNQTKNVMAAAVLNLGFGTTGVDGGRAADAGNQLFKNNHTREDGGTFSNVPSTPATLSEVSLEQSIIDTAAQVDGAGLLAGLSVRKLIVPPALQFQAERILGNKSMRPFTADRDINAMANMGMIPQGYVVNHYLTSTSRWFVLTTVQADEGLVGIERMGLTVESDDDFMTGNTLFKATEGYIFSWHDPRCVYGVNI